jgi:hypothetical protein
VFKSFEKYASKRYFKITTKTTDLSAFVDKIMIKIGHELTSRKYFETKL